MARQFVACAFTNGGRSYTYHNDGDPVAVGDKVEVETRHGIAVVDVLNVTNEFNSSFETKPIIGKHQPAEDTSNA